MNAGIAIDALVVGAICAFAWAGMQLGGRASVARLVAAYAGFALSALLRDSLGSVIESILGSSIDFARLVAMVVVGIGTYIATWRIVAWWLRRREVSLEDLELGVVDRLDGVRVAGASGAALGVAWAVLFVGMLVLVPSGGPISQAAVDSRTGGVLIDHDALLRWLGEGFPHYTQTLPKGDAGVVVGERGDIPLRDDVEPTENRVDANLLLERINDIRRAGRTRTLAFNSDVARISVRHAMNLAADSKLSRTTISGASLDQQITAALGDTAVQFDDEYGIEVAWAHRSGNAARGLADDDRAGALIRDPRWTEVGIGVADAGWFDGRIYTVILIGPVEDDEDAAASTGGDEASTGSDDLGDSGDLGAAAAVGSIPSGDDDDLTDDVEVPVIDPCEPVDLDGDGNVDSQSVDPSRTDCPDEPESEVEPEPELDSGTDSDSELEQDLEQLR